LGPDLSSFFTDPNLDPDPSVNKQKVLEKPRFLLFVTSFLLFIYEPDVTVPSKEISKKTLKKNTYILFLGILSATGEKSRIWIRISVVRIRVSVPQCHGLTDPQHCKTVATNFSLAVICFIPDLNY